MFLLAFSWNVIAADSVNLGVTGNIIASPCVFNGGSANPDINLGNIQATNMATPGSTSDPVPFNLQLPSARRGPAASRSRSPAPRSGGRYGLLHEQRLGDKRGDSHA